MLQLLWTGAVLNIIPVDVDAPRDVSAPHWTPDLRKYYVVSVLQLW